MRSLHLTTLSLITLITSSYALADGSDSIPSNPQQPLKVMPTYTSPADVRVNRSWDAYVTANFTYWEALQDNMELGIESTPPTGQTSIVGKLLNNTGEYKPGFQVGLGFGSSYDGWNTELLYTWFNSTTTTHKSVETGTNHILWPLWLSPQSSTFRSASEKWKVSLNSLDWILGRTSLIGKRLSLKPFFGLRAAWLNEQAHVNYYNAVNQASPYNLLYSGKSNSWGIGPEIGISSRWLLGNGFKLYGDLETDILYTRYTSLVSKEHKQIGAATATLRRDVSQHDLSALRPHCDVEIGVTWGSYLYDKAMHLELLLGYDFQVFWDQNMFRKFVDDQANASSLSSNGNLYLQGLTASVRFDF